MLGVTLLWSWGPSLQAFSPAVAAEGKVVPLGGIVRVDAPRVDALIHELLVKEGAWLEVGDPIAILHGLPLAEAEFAEAKAGLAEAKVVSEIAKKNELAALASEAKVEAVKQEAVSQNASAKAKIEKQIRHLNSILEDKDPPRRDRAEIEFNIKQLQLELEELAANWPSILLRLDSEIALAKARTAIVKMESSQVAAQVQAAEARVRTAEVRVNMLTVRAVQEGEVIDILAKPGERAGTAGILEMGNTRKMVVEAEVYLDDISKIEVGHVAKISGDGIEQYLEGKVTEIERTVARNALFDSDPSSFNDGRVIVVVIELSEADSAKAKTRINAQVVARIKAPAHAE